MKLLDAVIGVVDLKDGLAVHAIAGKRDRYRPVPLPGTQPGDTLELLRDYYAAGLRRFYFADLEAICNRRSQHQVIQTVLNALPSVAPETKEVFLDQGSCDAHYRCFIPLRSILATEVFLDPTQWRSAAEKLRADELVLGLDLQNDCVRDAACSDPPGKHPSFSLRDQVQPWVQSAIDCGCTIAVVLDLQFVGMQRGVGIADRCKQLSAWFPQLRWISGGGVKNRSDVQRLMAAGCEGVLVGTALHPGPARIPLIESFNR